MIKKLSKILVEDRHSSHPSVIKHVIDEELSFLSMENNWTHSFTQFSKIEIKTNPYRRIISYNVFGNGESILESQID